MRTLLMYINLLALLTLGSCIAPQDEEIDCQDCREQQIAIRLASDNATTRAGRPLYSNQPQQDVDRVMLIFCTNGQVVRTKQVKDWETVSKIYGTTNDGNHGRQAVVKLEGKDRLEASTTYTVYAIAYTYDENDENHRTAYTVDGENLDTYLTGLDNGTTFSKNLILTLSEAPGEEIFAGSASFTTSDSGGFYQTLVLNRQVAGVYMYVSAIPNINQAKELRLTAAADNDGLVLGQFDNEDYGQNSKQGNKVVNGIDATSNTANTNGRYTLCSIDFEKWKNKDGSWKNPYTDAKFEEDSYFSGNFVIPFAAQTDVQSLKMELIGDNGTIKEWNVNLPENDISTEIYTWSDNAFSINSSITESTFSYCLLRNHLYCIGSKKTDGGTDGDEPQPLDTGQDIQLKVIAEWDYVYDIMLEPTPGGSK